MREYYYYRVFKRTVVQFLDLFNDIQINRYTQDGTFLKRIKVPLQYGPKEKTWYWIEQRKDDEALPVMGVQMAGVEFSLERMTNKHRKVCTGTDETTISRFLNPVPYDITFQLGIWSLYMYDIDQILEQILPFFQPYVYIRIPIEALNTSFEAKVLFNSGTPEYESEYADEGRRILKYTLDFTVQTYMFKPVETTAIINEIFVNWYLNESSWRSKGISSTFTSGASGESMRLYGPSADDPDYVQYEIYQFGDKVGKTINFNHPSGLHNFNELLYTEVSEDNEVMLTEGGHILLMTDDDGEIPIS
jgi:hypothetical protein